MEKQKTKHKPHRQKHSGPQAERKKNKTKVQEEQSAKQRNPKAFAVQSVNKTARAVRRSADIKEKKHHIPVVDRTPLEAPPIVVAVVGPPKVGKTTLVKCLVKNFTQQNLSTINGPITIVSGKKRRLTILECNNDISSMIDVAKVADLVLLMVDASFGFEMETFEFLNIAQAHGFPKIMGVLTHLDGMKNNKTLTKTKKKLKHRFWKEVYQGAKLFYLSGMVHGEYMRREIHNLGRFISVMKFRPLIWRTSHSYILGDRMEDLTNPEKIRQNSKCDRDVSLYGYVRGTPLKLGGSVHLAGCGDFEIKDISFLPDPCPLPDKEKKRSLDSRERLIYAPMSGVGGIVYDKDVVYVELGNNKPKEPVSEDKNPTNELVTNLIGAQQTLDSKMATSQMTLFEGASPVTAGDVEEVEKPSYYEEAVEVDGRRRRRVKFEDEDDGGSGDDDESSSEEAEDEGFEDEQEEDTVPSVKRKPYETTKISGKKKMKMDLSGVEFADSDDDLEFETSVSRKKLSSNQRQVSTKEEERRSDLSEDESEDDEDDDDEEEREEEIVEKGIDLGGISEHRQKDDGNRKRELKNKNYKMKDSSRKISLQEKGRGSDGFSSSSNETSDEDDGEVGGSDVDEEEGESSEDDLKDGERQDGSVELREGIKKTGKVCEKRVKASDKKQANEDVRTKSVDRTKEGRHKNDFKNKQEQLKVRKGEVEKLIDEEEFDESSEESEDEIREDERMEEREKVRNLDESEEDEEMDAEEEESEDEDEDEGHLKWKENLAEKAEAAFIRQQQNTPNLRKMVYGELAENDSDDETEELGGLLTVTRQSKDEEKQRRGADGLDCSSFPVKHLRDWDMEEIRELIADCFVTGNWDADEDAQARLEKDDELYGDFEDLETGEVHKAEEEKEGDDDEDEDEDEGDDEDGNRGDKEDVKPALSVQEQDKLERQKRMEKKRKAKLGLLEDEEEGPSFFDEWKEEMEQQARLNRAEFEDMDDTIRTQYEGFRPGMYVRVELASVPCEFVTNFDPTCPMVLGGLQSNEGSIGFVQIRLKKHRWYPKILKTRDPLIFSVGWRRFQTIPLYCIQDHNGRNRLLKYTPEHLHCIATIWGPITPQGTGILAVQSLGREPGFRIAATGVILDLDKSINIVKKLKLTGIPFKVHKNTAFIKGMFNSALEVAKFEGALIRTVSGIRGQIKRASKAPPGAFRASFEDKLLLSDIVFLRTWYQVQLPKFYNPVTTMLLPKERKDAWLGMKTVGQLRREKNIPVPVNEDSLYKPIHRKERKFNRLVIPRKLAKELPFKYRPKKSLKKDGLTIAGTRAVIREPHERKIAALMEELGALYKNKEKKEKEERQKRSSENKKKLKADEEKLMTRQRKDKKEMFRLLGQMKKKKF